MHERKARLVAARILKVGESKIWINPEQLARVGEAMTKNLRALIKEGVVKKRLDHQQSRGRARVLLSKKRKGRKRGKGKRTGTKKVRKGDKKMWMKNVRAQRRVLSELKDSGAKFKKTPREIYLMIKGNYFRGKNYLKQMVEEGSK